ncbi:subunit alpha of proteasome [Hamiltosporidium tvaerminnensis]|uniref:Subunit alpha of proteasome n=2 Tax=Hamiltosporidium TaxID=1176354 RepID=A0A4Q9LQQ2_9MICR|nr:Proteasome subunit alpha type-4 [Hamiltosporidium tvaerminnensis]TBU01032.1 subunit alpha of proteasome [Hamiltosporidium magnivora]TBU04925.1 subunit alpha of proteasome [Hamiltosporidium tvaerminnensis]TBU09567.1 subunit alpha of proteasome [Hamiltosporidium magnivora]TBU09740.1 subunit alpha type-4 of proteasome [Hamiltosporidium magnivora]
MVYDNALAVFSPDGRLIQVEYAQHASEQGSLVVFSTSKEYISVCIEKKGSNKMLVEDDEQKIVLIDPDQHFYMAYAGLSPDSYVIIEKARVICRNYKLQTSENITLTQLAVRLSGVKQKYTIQGGKRPFGIRSILFGFEDEQSKAYIVEPDGNFSGYRCGSIGQKSGKVNEFMEKSNESDPFLLTISSLSEVIQLNTSRIVSFDIYPDKIVKKSEDEIKSAVSGISERIKVE